MIKESQGKAYHLRDYINGEEFDILMGVAIDLSKKNKDMSELDLVSAKEIYPTLQTILKTLITEPKVENPKLLDAAFLLDLYTYILDLFFKLITHAQTGQAKAVSASEEKKKA